MQESTYKQILFRIIKEENRKNYINKSNFYKNVKQHSLKI